MGENGGALHGQGGAGVTVVRWQGGVVLSVTVSGRKWVGMVLEWRSQEAEQEAEASNSSSQEAKAATR
ncbi:hypothetical protein NL676_008328 [Syzygium grande]|nr:hypothetical protein NL676_008328 [Syzygium grande]